MLLNALLFVAGLSVLYFAADALVEGSSRLALSFGISSLLVGMTVVAFATSMPELMVSLLASVRGADDMAAGNIIGSNIANIGLILGAAGLLKPMTVAPSVLRREIPFMVAVSILLYLFCMNGMLEFVDGLILFLLLLAFVGYCVYVAKSDISCTASEESQSRPARRGKDFFLVLAGIAGLGAGAELMVRSASEIARSFGISELVIGMTIVALGTSLPELAASLVSAWKGQMDLSVGNVIGSNIFNIGFVLGLCPMIHPLNVDPSLLRLEMPLMLLFSAILIPLLWRTGELGRGKASMLMAGYGCFIILLSL